MALGFGAVCMERSRRLTYNRRSSLNNNGKLLNVEKLYLFGDIRRNPCQRQLLVINNLKENTHIRDKI